MFIDTHAHLNDKRFNGIVEETIKYANDMQVGTIICSASSIETAYEVVSLSEKYDLVYETIGVHTQNL